MARRGWSKASLLMGRPHTGRQCNLPAETPRRQETVQLVDRAVGCNARVVLGNALAANESGVATIALAGIDTIDGEAGLVERFFSHGRLRGQATAALWSRLTTCAAGGYRRRTAARAIVGRLTIGRSLTSCPTMGGLVSF